MSEPVKTNGMTNTAILAASESQLGPIQKQVRFLMKEGMVRKACPNCGELHNMPEAAHVAVDEFNFGNHGDDRLGPCRRCGRTLIFTLPWPTGDWHWRLDPNEAAKHEKSQTA